MIEEDNAKRVSFAIDKMVEYITLRERLMVELRKLENEIFELLPASALIGDKYKSNIKCSREDLKGKLVRESDKYHDRSYNYVSSINSVRIYVDINSRVSPKDGYCVFEGVFKRYKEAKGIA